MTHYTILRYLPIADIGECINFGVLAYDEHRAVAKFTKDWTRIQRFGNRDIAFLKEIAGDFEQRCSAEAPAEKRLGRAEIEKLAERWIHSVQFSQPAGSILDAEKLAEHVAHKFLPQSPQSKPRTRDRRFVQRLAVNSLKDAIELRGGIRARELVKRDQSIDGENARHKFDIAVWNGTPKLLANSYSFEGVTGDRLTTSIHAGAYNFQDTRKKRPGVELAVVMLEPEDESENEVYAESLNIFGSIGARIVRENQISTWAHEVARKYAHT